MLFKKLVILSVSALFSLNTQATENCFIAKENGRIVKQEGQCDKRHAPNSTFKIPIALMGFDAGILKSSTEPVFDFTDEVKRNHEAWIPPGKYPYDPLWQRAQTPASWMRYSCVWYSQEVTTKLGMKKFNNYVQKLNYGNKDITGTPGKSDGLTACWLSNSLQISPIEQVDFIEKLSKLQLPFSKQAQEKTITIISLENVWDDWKLYGKTGSGKGGWFVGWIEKDNRQIAFAQYFEPEGGPLPAGRIAKEIAKDNLISVIMASQKA